MTEISTAIPTAFPQDFHRLWETRKLLVVELSWPPADTFKNGSRNRWVRARATKAYRAEAAWAGIHALRRSGADAPRWVRAQAVVYATIGVGRRWPDPTNLQTALEPAWDGFQDAGILQNDRGFRLWPIRPHGRAKVGRLVVFVGEIPTGPTAGDPSSPEIL